MYIKRCSCGKLVYRTIHKDSIDVNTIQNMSSYMKRHMYYQNRGIEYSYPFTANFYFKAICTG